MKTLNSLLLCLVYALYIVFGGIVFKFLEYEVIESSQIFEPPEWTHLKDLALREYPPADEDELLSLTTWLPRACPALSSSTVKALITRGSEVAAVQQVEASCPHLHQENVTQEVIYPRSFIEMAYFSMTVITTIGYGHISPTYTWSRIVCILYSLVGIPLTGILLAWTSNFFGDKLLHLFKSQLSEEKQHSHSFIAAATIIYITLGFLVFIFLPAGVFSSLEEEWTYMDSVYYCYITLTTIGFGDLVSGYKYEGTKLHVYHIGVILWIMVGLGYWVMVVNFISKALKSKQLKSSMRRSAEEMKKMMHQLGLKNHDPTFLPQHSKSAVNMMLQMSNCLAFQGAESSQANGMKNNPPDTSKPSSPDTASPSSTSPLISGGIPGISAIFETGLARGSPLSSLMGPMEKEFNMNYNSAPTSCKTSLECNVNVPDEAVNDHSISTKEEVVTTKSEEHTS